MTTSREIKQTASYLTSIIKYTPDAAIILGTGLGGLTRAIDIEHEIDYKTIPNFPVSTVEGHAGKLIAGRINQKKVVALQGRFHYYEGYDMQPVCLPVRVFSELGIRQLFVSNAAGGLNPEFQAGDIMIIDDIINLFGQNPLRQIGLASTSNVFVDMSVPFSARLQQLAKQIAKENKLQIYQGVYAGVTGPTFETRAEYRYLRTIGADAVGMSTVPEIIAARHLGMECFGVSVIANSGNPDQAEEVSHTEVQQNVEKAGVQLSDLFAKLISAS